MRTVNAEPLAEIERRSAIPGRERWESLALRGRPDRIQGFERLLGGCPGILTAEGNPLTGRILVQFDATLEAREVEALVRWAFSHVLAEAADPIAPAVPAGSGSAILGGLALLGGALCLLPLATGAALLSTPVVLGVTMVTTAFAAEPWRQAFAAEKKTASATASLAPLERLGTYAGRYRGRIILGCVCSAMQKVFDLGPPLLIGLGLRLVTGGSIPAFSALGLASVTSQIWLLGGLTCVVWFFESFFERSAIRVWSHLAQDVQHDLRVQAYAHVQRLEMKLIESDSVGRLNAVLSENIQQIGYFFREGTDQLTQLATTMVAISLYFVLLSPTLAWTALLPIPLILLGTLYFHSRVGPLYEQAGKEARRMSGQVVGNLGGILTIRSFNREEYELERVERASARFTERSHEAVDWYSAYKPSIRLTVLLGYAGTVVFGGWQVLSGTLNPGTYAMTQFLVQRILWPFSYVGKIMDELQKTATAVVAVFELLDAPLELPGGSGELRVPAVRGEVRFENVTFGYGAGPPVLEDFSLHLPAGETSAIVGATGVGKTTLAKLLLRFYDWAEGGIRLDGRDLRALRTSDLRRAIGLVSQESFLFDGSVFDNIAYGAREASREQVEQAASLAGAHEFITRLPQGYDSRVGERGVMLSGGQRQRICVARTLLKDPPILILDEATSSVDNETEAAMQRSLRLISGGRTVIIISHRLSTVRHAHQIYVLGERGRILERGTHEELLRNEGQYWMFWQIQSGRSGELEA